MKTSDEKYDQKLRRANKFTKIFFIIFFTFFILVIIYFILFVTQGKSLM
jgi:pilus assembly protein TadC